MGPIDTFFGSTYNFWKDKPFLAEIGVDFFMFQNNFSCIYSALKYKLRENLRNIGLPAFELVLASHNIHTDINLYTTFWAPTL